jgi:hypothetical protein
VPEWRRPGRPGSGKGEKLRDASRMWQWSRCGSLDTGEKMKRSWWKVFSFRLLFAPQMQRSRLRWLRLRSCVVVTTRCGREVGKNQGEEVGEKKMGGGVLPQNAARVSLGHLQRKGNVHQTGRRELLKEIKYGGPCSFRARSRMAARYRPTKVGHKVRACMRPNAIG